MWAEGSGKSWVLDQTSDAFIEPHMKASLNVLTSANTSVALISLQN